MTKEEQELVKILNIFDTTSDGGVYVSVSHICLSPEMVYCNTIRQYNDFSDNGLTSIPYNEYKNLKILLRIKKIKHLKNKMNVGKGG